MKKKIIAIAAAAVAAAAVLTVILFKTGVFKPKKTVYIPEGTTLNLREGLSAELTEVDPSEAGTAPTKAEMSGEYTARSEFPHTVGGVEVSDMFSYSGSFVEDGSGRQVSGIAAVRVRNNSSKAYQLLSLSFATDGGDIVFDVTALLPGAEMSVLSKEAVPYNADLLVSNVTAIKSLEFTETPSLNSDIFELSASGGVLGVKNISGKQVGNVYVYYKSTDSNGLFGDGRRGGRHRRVKHGGREYYYTAFFDPAEGGYRDYACLARGETEELYIDHCGGLWDSMIIDALDIPDRLLEVRAAFLHSSFITVGGEGILFAGNKQAGKSTQAALWSKYRGALTVNGDRAVIRLEGGGVHAYGSAFCGSSGIALDESAPVKAIVLLGQASENTVTPVPAPEAFRELLGKMTYDTSVQSSVEAAAAIAAEAVARVPVVRLVCTPDERSVEALEAALWRK